MATSKNSSPNEPNSETRPLAETQPIFEAQPLSEAPSVGRSGASMTPTSFVRRHAIGVGIIAAVLAVVVISGLTAWGVGTAVARSYENAAVASGGRAASAPPAARKPAAGARPNAGAVHAVVRGTIQAISGSTWTIATRAGGTQSITVDATTRYGTQKSPANASDFAVGRTVVVLEKSGGTGKTAVRVVAAHSVQGGAQPSTPATPGT